MGAAGGHRNLARAEFPLSAVPEGVKPSDFVLQRLQSRKLRPAGPALTRAQVRAQSQVPALLQVAVSPTDPIKD